MELPDVNVLVYAYRSDAPEHANHRAWLDRTTHGSSAFAMSGLVCSGVLRILTHPRVFQNPSSTEEAIAYVEAILHHESCVVVQPGPRHWSIFQNLCRQARARGNVVPDAYHAALSIEHGCEWITSDRGFARFPGLRYRFL